MNGMGCPLCGAALEKTANPDRLRCRSCRHVFDARQVAERRNSISGMPDHMVAAPFETQHMHERHTETDRTTAPSQPDMFVDEDLTAATASNMISRDKARQAQAQAQAQATIDDVGDPTPAQLSAAGKSTMIAFTSLFVVFILMSVFVSILDAVL